MKPWIFALLALCGACSKKEPPPHRTEPWLARPSASGGVTTTAPRSYHFSTDSRVRFTVVGRKGKVVGSAPLGEALLRLDPRDLKTAQASIDVDLTQLRIETDAPDDAQLGGASPTALALQWLELGAAVSAERRAQYGTARFELASVDDSSAATLDASSKKRASVRATLVGTLLIHGFRAPVRAEVVLTPLEAAPGATPRLSIRSATALVVPLGPHDIVARGPSGTADGQAQARAADWVGKSVRIEVELNAQADK